MGTQGDWTWGHNTGMGEVGHGDMRIGDMGTQDMGTGGCWMGDMG